MMRRPNTRSKAAVPTGARRAVGLSAVLLGAALLSACASVGNQVQRAMLQQLEDLSLQRTILPYEIDDEVAQWVEDRAKGRGDEMERIQELVDVLLAEDGLNISYRREPTLTAREVFDQRQANCLSFTMLFVGLARQRDLEVFFLEVEDLEDYGRDGDLVVHSDHIAVGVGPNHEMTVIDFAREEAAYRRVRPLTDREAIALYYSNRGAELLREGQLEEARSWLADATRVYPYASGPWVNLGVTWRRLGDLAAAERSYRAALENEPTDPAALHNLAGLLARQDRDEEAMAIRELAASSENRNPYALLALADLSLSHDRDEEAERLYRRALRLQGRDPEAEFLAALGLFELRQGDARSARRLFKRAAEIDRQHPRVRQLERMLDG